MRTNLLSFLTICLVTVGVIACDVTGEQNYDFKVGDSLAIEGGPKADTLFLPRYRVVSIDSSVTPNDTTFEEIADTTSYYTKAFTIKKDYKWTVSPDIDHNVRRKGEFIDIIATSADAGDYTISVDDGEYQGKTNLVVVDTTSTP